jgi:hypothetical protein
MGFDAVEGSLKKAKKTCTGFSSGFLRVGGAMFSNTGTQN